MITDLERKSAAERLLGNVVRWCSLAVVVERAVSGRESVMQRR